MSKPKVGVILSGCGNRDGAEIHESVFAMLALDKAGCELVLMAPALKICGAKHERCEIGGVAVDGDGKFVTAPAYKLAPSLEELAADAEKLVAEVLRLVKKPAAVWRPCAARGTASRVRPGRSLRAACRRSR